MDNTIDVKVVGFAQAKLDFHNLVIRDNLGIGDSECSTEIIDLDDIASRPSVLSDASFAQILMNGNSPSFFQRNAIQKQCTGAIE